MLKYILLSLAITYALSAQDFTCTDGEYLDKAVTPNKCKSCQEDCKTCTEFPKCATCYDLWFLNKDKICKRLALITIANCIAIESSDATSQVCTACKDGYWLKSDNTCVAKTLTANCNTWQSKVTTETCGEYKAGFSLVGTTIITCFTNCVTCSSTTVCTECAETYYLGTDGKCTLKTGNCETWKVQDTEECASCPTGYTQLPSNKKFCYATQCTNTNSSASCGNGKARSSAPVCDLACFAGSNCADCSTEADGQCKECTSLYLLSGGKCYTKLTNCAGLDDSNPTKCSSCDATFVLSNAFTCVAKTDHCTTMKESAKCSVCDTGYYLASDACTVCTEHCTCSVSTNLCSGCASGYKFKDSEPTGSAGSCEVCTATNCKTCTVSADTCDACNEGYGMDGKNCGTCTDTNCKLCAAAKATCTKCNSGYTLLTGATTCTVNIANCNEMSTTTTCKTCADGYYISGTTCTQCKDANCQACDANGKTCTVCKSGYYVDKTKGSTADVDAVCIQCTVANAKYQDLSCKETQFVKFPWTCTDLTGNCAENNPTPDIGEAAQSCSACKPGFMLKTDGACVACPANCYDCQADVAKCTECNTGFFANSTNLCSACDATTCTKCTATECTDCKPIFAFQDADKTKCLACTKANCIRCDEKDTCLACLDGFFVAAAACTACSTNCTDCDTTSDCYACKDGSYLKGKVCSGCIDNCKTCSADATCTICNSGYDLNAAKTACTKSSSGTPSGNECLTSVSGCSKCDATTTTTCVLCKSGSAPVSGACTCGTGIILIAGECVTQSTEALPADISAKNLNDLASYVTIATKTDAATNTKNILARIDTILTAEKTDANAGKSLSLLLQFASTANESASQTSYGNILKNACSIDLSESNFYIAFTAADKVMAKATDKKGIYQLGFSTCMKKLLSKSTISDISLLQLDNSELALKSVSKVAVDAEVSLTGVSFKLTQALKTAAGDANFALFQAIKNTANPYAADQTNNVTLSSKIVSLTVMTPGASSAEQAITLKDSNFTMTFDTAGTSGKCAYYNTTTKKWTDDGTLSTKTCTFNHLTDFVIYDSGSTTKTENAYTLQALSILLLFIIALF